MYLTQYSAVKVIFQNIFMASVALLALPHQRSVMAQEPLTNLAAVSSNPAYANFLSSCKWEKSARSLQMVMQFP